MHISHNQDYIGASLVAQLVKNSPATQEIWVWSLDQEEPLEKETATCSNILACEIPQTEEPGGLQSMGLQRVGHDLATKPAPPGLYSIKIYKELPQIIQNKTKKIQQKSFQMTWNSICGWQNMDISLRAVQVLSLEFPMRPPTSLTRGAVQVWLPWAVWVSPLNREAGPQSTWEDGNS